MVHHRPLTRCFEYTLRPATPWFFLRAIHKPDTHFRPVLKVVCIFDYPITTSWGVKPHNTDTREEGQTIQWPIEEGQTIQWPIEEGQTIQWPIEEGQTIQWPIEEGQTIQWPIEEGHTIQWPIYTKVYKKYILYIHVYTTIYNCIDCCNLSVCLEPILFCILRHPGCWFG